MSLDEGCESIARRIDSLTEPLRDALEQLDSATAAWLLLTPHHHLLTYDDEVAFLHNEWVGLRDLFQRMAAQSETKPARIWRRGKVANDDLERSRAQLAAVEVRLRVLESQRKASSVVDVLPADVAFAGHNVRAAQEWATTLETELAELCLLRDQLLENVAA